MMTGIVNEPASTETVYILPHTTPRESMLALQQAVASQFDWRIVTREPEDQPRFLIEKQVRYDILRGWSAYAVFQIGGDFRKTETGDTRLAFMVSGQNGVPLLSASVHTILILVALVVFNLLVADLPIASNQTGFLINGGLIALVLVYGWLAYRRYQTQVQELNTFMTDFTRSTGARMRKAKSEASYATYFTDAEIDADAVDSDPLTTRKQKRQ